MTPEATTMPGSVARSSFHGRVRELRQVVGALSSPPSLVVIEGEAGSGKSRLILEALGDTALQGRPVLVGNCTAVGEPTPLEPVAAALRGLAAVELTGELSPVCGVLRPILPELAHLLPETSVPEGDPPALRRLVHRAVRELLRMAGDVVLVLEDLHRADRQTLDVLAKLVGDTPSRLSVVASHRRSEERRVGKEC